MSYYQHHAFFCCNEKPDGKTCCQQHNATALYKYAKDKCRALNKLGAGHLGVSQSRCLGRCQQGPVIVVYPQAVWYQWQSKKDIDDIINEHLLQGKIVKRLQIT